MKREWIKTLVKAVVGKLAATATMLLFLVLIPAAAAGTLPLWAAVLLGLGAVLVLNAACGILLEDVEPSKAGNPVAPAPARQVSLRVVRGGRAA